MRIKEIFDDRLNIYRIVDTNYDDLLEYLIEPCKDESIPYDDDYYLVKGYIVAENSEPKDCFLTVATPERIIDFVIYNSEGPKVGRMYSDFKDQEVILGVPSLGFGLYQQYYAIHKPEIGIEILKKGILNHPDNSNIAHDLGYILRDEKRYEEALEAFLASLQIQNPPLSYFTYSEIAYLYKELGDSIMADKFKDLFNAAKMSE